eukprot:TRINITY_DN23561_c0_g1_i1.p1 TRINITY_DN23561_c0_g1~~TRINITY_DN23561_c0_g1_i1.p1  ORF type:complete len:1464 (-),score=323.08 TRINITY_DN23561_c0_g1_i1:42-4409(-)
MTIAKDGANAGAGAPRTSWNADLMRKEGELHALQQELARQCGEAQRHSNALRVKDEELLRRERAAASLREQRQQLERDSSDLRGKLSRKEVDHAREITELRSRLGAREREVCVLEREAAVQKLAAEEARQQLALRKETYTKDRDNLFQELSDLRLEYETTVGELQRRVREQEAELQKQRVDFAARLEEERRGMRRFEREQKEEPKTQWRDSLDFSGLYKGSGRAPAALAGKLGDGSGLPEREDSTAGAACQSRDSQAPGKIDAQQERSPNEGLAAAAVSKMRALEEQLQALQNSNNTASTASALEPASMLSTSGSFSGAQWQLDGPERSRRLERGPLDIEDMRVSCPAVLQTEEACVACGARLAAEALFCMRCGQRREVAGPPRGGSLGTGTVATAAAQRCREAELLAERAQAACWRAEAVAAQRSAAYATSVGSMGMLSHQPSLVDFNSNQVVSPPLTTFQAASQGQGQASGPAPSASATAPAVSWAPSLPDARRDPTSSSGAPAGNNSAPVPVGSAATITAPSPLESSRNSSPRAVRHKETSPTASSARALSPTASMASQRETRQASVASLPGNAAGSIHASALASLSSGFGVANTGCGPQAIQTDLDSPRRSLTCQSGTSSPKPHGAGRLPPTGNGVAQSHESCPCPLDSRPSMGERGSIGPISDFSPQPLLRHSWRVELEIDDKEQEKIEADGQIQEADEAPSGTASRLKQAWSDGEAWRRRTLLLEERLQQVLQERAEAGVESQTVSVLHTTPLPPQSASLNNANTPASQRKQPATVPASPAPTALEEAPSPFSPKRSPLVQREERQVSQELALRRRPRELEIEENSVAGLMPMQAGVSSRSAALPAPSSQPLSLQNQQTSSRSLAISPSATSIESTPLDRPGSALMAACPALPPLTAIGNVVNNAPTTAGSMQSDTGRYRFSTAAGDSSGGSPALPLGGAGVQESAAGTSPAPSGYQSRGRNIQSPGGLTVGSQTSKAGYSPTLSKSCAAPTPPPAPAVAGLTPSTVDASSLHAPSPPPMPPSEAAQSADTSPPVSSFGPTLPSMPSPPAASPIASTSPALSPPGNASPRASSLAPSPPCAPSLGSLGTPLPWTPGSTAQAARSQASLPLPTISSPNATSSLAPSPPPAPATSPLSADPSAQTPLLAPSPLAAPSSSLTTPCSNHPLPSPSAFAPSEKSLGSKAPSLAATPAASTSLRAENLSLAASQELAPSPEAASIITNSALSASPAGSFVKAPCGRSARSQPSAPSWSPAGESIASEATLPPELSPTQAAPAAPATPGAFACGQGTSPRSSPAEAASWMLLMTPEASAQATTSREQATPSLRGSDRTSALASEGQTSRTVPEAQLADSAYFIDASSTKCPSCGNVYMADSLWCRHCGRKRDITFAAASALSASPQPPSAPPETPASESGVRVTDALRALQERRHATPSSATSASASPAKLSLPAA